MRDLDYRSLALAALFEALAEVQDAAEGRTRGGDPSHEGALSRGARGEDPSHEGALSRGARGGDPSYERALSRGARGGNPSHEKNHNPEREGEPPADEAISREREGQPLGEIDHLLAPLFAIDADSVAAVFATPARYARGVKTAASAIAGERKALRLLNTAFAVLELATLLQREDRIAWQLSQRLSALADAPRDAALLLALDEVYQESIGRLGKRIQVSGDPAALRQPQVAARIRALLLAAVRFAWLWRQLGGRRWQLIVGRRKALAAMDQLKRQLA